MTADHYPGGTVLRIDVLARLLVERLASLGPISEAEAIDSLDVRAGVAGRGAEVVQWASQRGFVRRVQHGDEPATLEATGPPRSLAA